MTFLGWVWKLFLLLGLCILAVGVFLWLSHHVIVEVDEAALPEIPATPEPVDFSVMTYNVQARPLLDKTKVRFEALSPLLNPYDFVAIQECFYNHEGLWEGTTHPARIYHNTRKHPLKLVNSGLAMLARYPLEGVETAHYSVDGDRQNWPANKGIIMGHFRVGGMPLDVYDSHFAAGRNGPSRREKPIQSREAIEFVQTHSPPEHAVIFLGDFNMKTLPEGQGLSEEDLAHAMDVLPSCDRDECLQVIKKVLGLTDVAEELGEHHYDIPDHILYRSGTQARLEARSFQFDGDVFYLDNGEPLSDHEPLMAGFRLTPP